MRTVTGEVITGQAELREETVRTVAAGAHLTNKPRLCLTGDDTALVIVDWTMEVTTPDGTRVSPTGTTTAVARRSADGAWLFTVLNPLGTA
jgi:ketosteroid isomerase-like protein